MVESSKQVATAYKNRMTLTAGGVLRGIKRLFPIAIFVIPFGIAFGVAAVETGMTPAQSIVMSALTFSGAAQFAALDFWHDPIALGSLALVALALNARHIIMGAALSPWLSQISMGKRILILTYLSDPNFADSQPAFRSGERDAGVLLGGGLVLWFNWIAGTAIGAAGGSLIGDPSTYGIDVVMVCFFAAVVVGQVDSRTSLLPVITAAIVSVLTLSWLPTGWNVILGAFAGGVVAMVFHAE